MSLSRSARTFLEESFGPRKCLSVAFAPHRTALILDNPAVVGLYLARSLIAYSLVAPTPAPTAGEMLPPLSFAANFGRRVSVWFLDAKQTIVDFRHSVSSTFSTLHSSNHVGNLLLIFTSLRHLCARSCSLRLRSFDLHVFRSADASSDTSSYAR